MKTRLFAFAALGIALTACTKYNESLNDGPVAAQFTADIHKAVSTRVNSEGTGFTDGDRIGITGAVPLCLGSHRRHPQPDGELHRQNRQRRPGQLLPPLHESHQVHLQGRR